MRASAERTAEPGVATLHPAGRAVHCSAVLCGALGCENTMNRPFFLLLFVLRFFCDITNLVMVMVDC